MEQIPRANAHMPFPFLILFYCLLIVFILLLSLVGYFVFLFDYVVAKPNTQGR